MSTQLAFASRGPCIRPSETPHSAGTSPDRCGGSSDVMRGMLYVPDHGWVRIPDLARDVGIGFSIFCVKRRILRAYRRNDLTEIMRLRTELTQLRQVAAATNH